MKCNIKNTNRTTTNLTLNQVLSKYVIGYTPAAWVENIKVILSTMNSDGSTWIWPNAHLVFTRNGNLYTVERM